MPAISVIIPSYNCSRFVGAAVESSLAQTCADIEIIVVDDGSTDDTQSALQNYFTNPQFHYIYQENRGLPAARNAGARNSHAEYLAFLDADDELDPRALALMKAELDRSQASWCLIDILKVRAKGSEIHRTTMPPADLFHAILSEDFIRRGMFFRRADFVSAGMYDENMRYREDWEINIRMFEAGRPVVYLPQPLYHYHYREGSITTGNKPGVLHYTGKILRKHHKRLADAGNDTVAKIYAANIWDLGRKYFYTLGDYKNAFACIRESLIYDPDIKRILHPVMHHFRRLLPMPGRKPVPRI